MLARQLAARDARIAELDLQIETLRVSHIAMIRAMAELGGTTKLLAPYDGYRELRDGLGKMDLLPQTEVISLDSASTKHPAN